MDNLYEYLDTKDYKYYLKEEISNYKDTIPKEDKAIELINLMALLHNKTTTNEEIDTNKINSIYEELKQQLTITKNFYLNYQDYIESKIYFYPEEYLLIRNISKIYQLLDRSNNYLEEWYKKQQKESRYRICIQHQNLKLKNLIIRDKTYLINRNNSKKDLIIYDFINFYKNEYQYLEMTSLYEQYQRKYPYTKTEQLLLFSILGIPNIIKFTKSHYNNTVLVKYLIIYVDKTYNLISKYYKEDQYTNE